MITGNWYYKKTQMETNLTGIVINGEKYSSWSTIKD